MDAFDGFIFKRSIWSEQQLKSYIIINIIYVDINILIQYHLCEILKIWHKFTNLCMDYFRMKGSDKEGADVSSHKALNKETNEDNPVKLFQLC